MFDAENRKNIVSNYIKKSFKTFDDAELLAKNESWNSCANRLYYSAFYIITALLIYAIDVRSKTHKGVKNLFHENFIKTDKVSQESAKLYSYLMELRAEGDYGDFEMLEEDEVKPLMAQTKKFIMDLKELMNK